MKKLMISTIILLPLLLLAILLVSGAIASMMTHIYVESVEFVDNSTLELWMDDEENPPSEQLEVNVLPLKADNRGIVFSVDDENIATVDENGKIVAKYYGTTYVTVTSAENKRVSAKRAVRVTDKHVHGIEIGEHDADMYRGDDSVRLLAKVFPADADNTNVVWESSDPGLLSITKDGIATCNGRGSGDGVVTVTAASADNPEVKATTVIRCHEPLSGISAEDTPVLTAQKTQQFPAVVPYPANATYSLSYTSSDTDIATVNGEGGITFHNYGYVKITATARDGRGHEDSVSVDYNSTYGYYEGPLFGSTREYTFDYDEIIAAGGALKIHFLEEVPEGSGLRITDVAFENPDPEGEDLIEYDAAARKFFLKDVGDELRLGSVRITVHADKYDLGDHTVKTGLADDVCTVTITRKTGSLSFVAGGKESDALSLSNITPTMDVTFSELETDAQNAVVVRAAPANHTDEIQYSLGGTSDCARLEGKMLKFSKPGTAAVTVRAGDAEKTLTVTFTQKQAEDVTVTLGETAPEKNISLDFVSADNNSKGILEFVTPQGYIATVTSQNEEVIKVEGLQLVPQKGGFATVAVSFRAADEAGISAYASDMPAGYTVNVYVDKPLVSGDITFSAEGKQLSTGETFVTSKAGTALTITVNAKDGAMEGKELWMDGASLTPSEEGETYIYTKEFTFTGAQTLSVQATVKHGSRAVDYGSTESEVSNNCKLQSTGGKIVSGLTVKNGETAFTDGSNKLTFNNIGETSKTTLTFSAETPEPADFVLQDNLDVSALESALEAGGYLSAELTFTDENTLTAQLTAVKGTYNGDQTLTLEVAGKTVTVVLKVLVPADRIEVKYGSAALTAGESYTTFLSELGFTVTLSRTDGKAVSAESKKFSDASFGGASCTVQQQGSEASFTVTAKLGGFEEQTLSLAAEGGNATFTLNLKKLDVRNTTFTYSIEYSSDGGEHKLTDQPITADGENVFYFPRGLRSFGIRITPAADGKRLGGLAEEPEQEEERNFTVTAAGGDEVWSYIFNPQGDGTGYLEVTVPDKTYFYNDTVIFRFPDGEGDLAEATLTISCPNIHSVQLTSTDVSESFDSSNTAMDGPVYKGYQQVRVFAKHSDFGDGNIVDYIRMPVKVESEAKKEGDLADAVWNLTRHNDKEGKIETLTWQRGTEVRYKGETYTIVEVTDGAGNVHPSKLVKGGADGTTVAEGGKYTVAGEEQIPWVDVFAEDGYAHIYFGNFGGLSEVDVQNDYFGNFGEKENWKRVEQTVLDAKKEGSDRDFTPSGNAYSYLRVAVGDGSVDSAQASMKDNTANKHFNFNVLQEDTLVNVYNAAGYYKHSNIVLHENLYGDGELGNEGATFTKATEKGLFLNQVANLGKTLIYGNGYQVNLQAKTASMDKYSESDGIAINRAYNTVIKCANPNNEISNKYQKMVFKMAYAYYCDLSYYYKFNPAGSAFYAKNTIFSSISKTAVQLYYNESLYVENCVFTECGTAIQVDNSSCLEPHIYIKGGFDALNYFNKTALDNLNPWIGMFYASVVSGVKDYLEWHGKTFTANASSYADKSVDKIYVNILLFGYAPLTENLMAWDGDSYEKATPLADGSKIVSKTLYSPYCAWTYDTLDENGARLDGATVEANSYGQATVTAVMSQLFTEKRYIRLQCEFKEPGVKNYEHILWHRQGVYRDYSIIGEREDHMTNLRESLKGTTWDDGSGVGADGIPFDPPAAALAMNELLSETVVPSKRTY